MTKKESGQSLVEILAALGVVILVILALVVIATASIRNATFAKNQSLANKYAQEAIERARELRDRNTDKFFDTSSAAYADCIAPPPIVSPFLLTRTCTLEGVPGNEKMTVEVVVSWTDGKGEHQSKLTTYLTKW